MTKRTKPEPNLSLEEMRQALSIGLRDKVNAVAEQFKHLKTREVGRKLGKHELCPLCGNADIPGSCTCIGLSKSEGVFKIQKNAVMGYDANGNTNAAPMAMSEDKLEKCAKCGSTHKIGTTYDHDLVKEKDANIPVDDPLGPEAVLPDDKKVKEPDETGSGGETKKLAKEALSPVAHANAQMGKFKSLAHNPLAMPGNNTPLVDKPKLAKAGALEGIMGGSFKPKGSMGPAPSQYAPAKAAAAAPSKVNGMHPDTAASLGAVKAMAPNAQPSRFAHLSPVVRANAQMAKFKSLASNPLAMPGNTPLVNPKAMSGHSVSGTINAKPAPAISQAPAGQPKVQIQADAAKPGAAQSAAQDAANLAADKKAAGVGFLQNLISRFRKPAPQAPIGTGPVRSQASPYQGIRGMAALARSEMGYGNDLIKSLGDCAICLKNEHLGEC